MSTAAKSVTTADTNVSTIIDDVREILEQHLPPVQNALAATECAKPAAITISVKWVPGKGEKPAHVAIDGKASLPASGSEREYDFDRGQMRLLF